MPSINSISSLLPSLPRTQQSASIDASDSLGSSLDAGSLDTFTLSAASQEKLKVLIDLSQASTETDRISELLCGSQGSDDFLYDIMMSAENVQILKDNPSLAKLFLADDQAETSEGISFSSALPSNELCDMSASDLLSIIQKYNDLYSGSAATDTSSSQLDETV